jgi:hypothetical protein
MITSAVNRVLLKTLRELEELFEAKSKLGKLK